MQEEYTLNELKWRERVDDPEDEAQTEVAVRALARMHWRLPFRLNTAVLGAVLMVGAVAAGLTYLSLSNHLINQGFAFNEAKKHLEAGLKENRELELAVMQSESSERVNERIAVLGLVNAGDIVYVEIKNQGVARR